jgi:hypothetical protein
MLESCLYFGNLLEPKYGYLKKCSKSNDFGTFFSWKSFVQVALDLCLLPSGKNLPQQTNADKKFSTYSQRMYIIALSTYTKEIS